MSESDREKLLQELKNGVTNGSKKSRDLRRRMRELIEYDVLHRVQWLAEEFERMKDLVNAICGDESPYRKGGLRLSLDAWIPLELIEAGDVAVEVVREMGTELEIDFMGTVHVRLDGRSAALLQLLSEVKVGPDGKRAWMTRDEVRVLLQVQHGGPLVQTGAITGMINRLRDALDKQHIDRNVIETEGERVRLAAVPA